jgi:hypothetical protein
MEVFEFGWHGVNKTSQYCLYNTGLYTEKLLEYFMAMGKLTIVYINGRVRFGSGGAGGWSLFCKPTDGRRITSKI